MNQDAEMNEPTMLVVMPVWNCEKYVFEAIESILSQKNVEFDFLIINDGSTDRTSEILGSINDPRVIIINRPHRGLCQTMNEAIHYAKLHNYTYLARMDADDISLPGRLQALKHCLDKGQVIGVGSNCAYINKMGARVGSSTVASHSAWIGWEIGHGLRGIIQGAAAFRVDALIAIGGYREIFEVAEDTDLFLRLRDIGPMTNVKETLYLIRQTSGSRSRADFLKNILYSNFALDCIYRRSRGIPERSLEAYLSQNPLRMINVYREIAGLRIWEWSRDGKWHIFALPLAICLLPLRTLSRIVRLMI